MSAGQGGADGEDMSSEEGTVLETWRDPAASIDERVKDLISKMTTAEKVAQLYGIWLAVSEATGEVMPYQVDLEAGGIRWDDLLSRGVGQLTRYYGTAPSTRWPALAPWPRRSGR